MKWRRHIKPQRWILPALVALLLAYTADQLLTGERGIVTWRVMKTQVENLRGENDALKTGIATLEKNVARLKPAPAQPKTSTKGIDFDYVDELLRRDLGYIKPGERIILISPSSTGL